MIEGSYDTLCATFFGSETRGSISVCLVRSNGEMLAAAMLADKLCSASGVNAQKIKDVPLLMLRCYACSCTGVIFVDPSTTVSPTCLREFVLWFALPGLVGRPALMLPLQAGTPMAEP